jgi:hypothetical protein
MFKFKSLMLAAALSSSSALAMEVNIDIVNQGPEAHDFVVVLKGAEQINQTYDGAVPGDPRNFENVTKLVVNGKTFIHWQNLGGVNAAIPPGGLFHIGWNSVDGDTDIEDMYFTDEFGQRIRCSTALVVGGHFDPVRNVIGIAHAFDVTTPIDVRDIRVAVVPRALPLSALNPSNRELMAAMRPVATAVRVGPGERLSLPSPVRPQPGQAVVMYFVSTGEGTSARATSFTQVTVGADGTTSTRQKTELAPKP